MSYLYRVRVVKYPDDSLDEHGLKYGWAPPNWDPGTDPYYEEPVFSWPHQRQYLSRGNAVRRAELFRKYGAEVVVERSNPITWPEEATS